MNRLLILLFLLLPFLGNAQGNDSIRTLQIVGNARVFITPDLGVLNIHLSQIDTNFNKSITRLGDKTNYYVKILVGLGFKEEEIKTTNFNVAQNRIYRREQMIDSGYIASQDVKVEFVNDKKILTKILNKFSTSQSTADFSFSFKLSEKLKTEVQNKVIELAIKDARTKAELISKSSFVKIKGIRKINYGNPIVALGNPLNLNFSAYKAPDADNRTFNFTPDDIEFQDSITFDWIIE